MDEILKTKEYSKEQEGITKLGENHVFYLPYLMGERSPHNDPKPEQHLSECPWIQREKK